MAPASQACAWGSSSHMTEAAYRTGSLSTALAHAARLLPEHPDLAAGQAREILRVVPNYPEARRLLGAALRLKGDAAAAAEVLKPLARERPDASTLFELGLALGDCGEPGEAISALKRVVRL